MTTTMDPELPVITPAGPEDLPLPFEKRNLRRRARTEAFFDADMFAHAFLPAATRLALAMPGPTNAAYLAVSGGCRTVQRYPHMQHRSIAVRQGQS